MSILAHVTARLTISSSSSAAMMPTISILSASTAGRIADPGTGSDHTTTFFARYCFEGALVAEARRHGVDGVICGHIHHPELQRIGNVEYANSGDWVESCTALVEDFNGQLKILRYFDKDHKTNGPASRATDRFASGDALPTRPPMEWVDGSDAPFEMPGPQIQTKPSLASTE